MSIAQKRIVKDIKILEINKDELNSRGIFWHFNEENIQSGSFLIMPKHKQRNNELQSPYTGGIFVFTFNIPDTFPLEPPKLEFNPKQNMCRLHPNYYENGKVCLSVINTWSSPDWTPSMSLMSIANILEERFNENSLCFEPSKEQESQANLIQFNKIVQYSVVYVALNNVFENKYREYDIFKDIIKTHWDSTFLEKVAKLAQEYPRCISVKQPSYQHQIDIDWPKLYEKLKISITIYK
jgi:ubiquitin-protein ligase